MHIRRNDIVEVITGDERKKKGKVLRVIGEDRVLVEGINFVWKHLRRSQQHPHGARIQKEAPLRISNLALVCTSCEKPTRVAHKRLESGEHVRVCKKCRQPITARA
jgi:large subunit ribosomal protein L24